MKLRRKFFFAGQILVKEGSESAEMYGIHSGHVVVEQRGVCVGDVECGCCFGEMAVFGVATLQTVSVRAHTICDMQVLHGKDLEELFEDFPHERKRLLQIIGTLLRQDLSQVTNSEVLAEISWFAGSGAFLGHLGEYLEVELQRKGDEFRNEQMDRMLVLLQGSAQVEVGGVVVRELSHGDAFGVASLLGPVNVEGSLRATATTLWLTLTRDIFREALSAWGSSQTAATWDTLMTSLTLEQGQRLRVLGDCAVVKKLDVPETCLRALNACCEETIFVADEVMLTSHSRGQAVLIMLAGSARLVVGSSTTAVVQKGACLGRLTLDTVEERGEVVSSSPCRVLLLHKAALKAFVELGEGEDRDIIASKFGAVPRGERRLSPRYSLRSHVDELVAQYIAAAKWNVRGLSKTMKKSGKWHSVRSGMLVGRLLKDLRGTGAETGSRAMMDGDCQASAPQNSSQKHKSRAELERETQERTLCRDFCDLAATARRTAEDARRDELVLRQKVDELRSQFALSRWKDASVEDVSEVAEATPSLQPSADDMFEISNGAEVEERRKNVVLERRAAKLRAKLEESCRLRTTLLSRLRETYVPARGVVTNSRGVFYSAVADPLDAKMVS